MKYLVVGAGIYGCTIARLLKNSGNNVTIIDRRSHIGGNCYDVPSISNDFYMTVHKYGPHIFHTSNQKVKSFITKYANFNNYKHNVIAKNCGKLYHLPFNMTTFYEVFNTDNILDIKKRISNEVSYSGLSGKEPKNLEEKAIQLVGTTIYELLIKNYTEKQWGRKCTELSTEIISRIPMRWYYDNNYFYDSFQGIPVGGYTQMIQRIINGIENEFSITCLLGIDLLKDMSIIRNYDKIIYCGAVDELLNYQFGELEWRSLSFENISYKFSYESSEGIAQTNLTGNQDGTRIIDHIYFTPESLEAFMGVEVTKTLEVPQKWTKGKERYYTINNEKNEKLYTKYVNYLKEKYPNIILGGRLGKYKYLDMDDAILAAINDYNIV